MKPEDYSVIVEFENGGRLRFGPLSLGIGHVMATALSWTANQSVAWCVVHGILGWLYVGYYALGGGH